MTYHAAMTLIPPVVLVALGPVALVAVLVSCASPTPSGEASAPSTTTVAAVTLATVLAHLQAAGATAPKVTFPESDPNHLQGRPGQYTDRATFVLPGGDPASDRVERGGVVEMFSTSDAARVRSAYIEDTLKASPILGAPEWHYMHGGVLVRVTPKVTPDVAGRIGTAVAGLP